MSCVRLNPRRSACTWYCVNDDNDSWPTIYRSGGWVSNWRPLTSQVTALLSPYTFVLRRYTHIQVRRGYIRMSILLIMPMYRPISTRRVRITHLVGTHCRSGTPWNHLQEQTAGCNPGFEGARIIRGHTRTIRYW